MKTIEQHLQELFVGKEVKFQDNGINPIETKGIVTDIKFNYDTCLFYLKNSPLNHIELCTSGDGWGIEIIT